MKVETVGNPQIMFDLTFTRNLSATLIVVTMLSLSLSTVRHHPQTMTKQKQFTPIENAMRMGLVIKGQQLRYR